MDLRERMKQHIQHDGQLSTSVCLMYMVIYLAFSIFCVAFVCRTTAVIIAWVVVTLFGTGSLIFNFIQKLPLCKLLGYCAFAIVYFLQSIWGVWLVLTLPNGEPSLEPIILIAFIFLLLLLRLMYNPREFETAKRIRQNDLYYKDDVEWFLGQDKAMCHHIRNHIGWLIVYVLLYCVPIVIGIVNPGGDETMSYLAACVPVVLIGNTFFMFYKLIFLIRYK